MNNQMMNVTVRMPKDLKRRIDKMAKTEDRSISAFVCRAIEAAMKTEGVKL